MNTGISFFILFFSYNLTAVLRVGRALCFREDIFYCCISIRHAKKVVAGILDQPATMLTGDVQLPASAVVIAMPGIKSKKRT